MTTAKTLYIGSYTTIDQPENQRGLHHFKLDERGRLIALSSLDIPSPSFLTLHPTLNTLYSVNEVSEFQGTSGGGISAVRLPDENDMLKVINACSSHGFSPCHLAVDATGTLLVVSNYGDGSVSLFPILPDGRLGEKSDFHKHEGQGPYPSRQEAPHAHGVTFSPDNRYLLVPDLGIDEIRVYRVDVEARRLIPNDPPSAKTVAGAGPRHAVFSTDERHVYVVNELDNTVAAFDWDAGSGRLSPLGASPTLPRGWWGQNTTAEIVVHPSGNHVYASNRGHNSVAIFHRDPASGILTPTDHLMMDGPEPRSFAISADGNWLVVGNQKLNTISSYRVTEGGAAFEIVGTPVSVNSPVCILFAR